MKLLPIGLSFLGAVMLTKAESDVQRTVGAVVLGTGMSRMLNEAIGAEARDASQTARLAQSMDGVKR